MLFDDLFELVAIEALFPEKPEKH